VCSTRELNKFRVNNSIDAFKIEAQIGASTSAEWLLTIPTMTTTWKSMLPLDEQLAVYRQCNGQDRALTANYVSAGDLIAERVGSHNTGVHSFVYRILQPGYPRYYPVYRFGSIGEVHEIQEDDQVRPRPVYGIPL
jgi:hypothetical protein